MNERAKKNFRLLGVVGVLFIYAVVFSGCRKENASPAAPTGAGGGTSPTATPTPTPTPCFDTNPTTNPKEIPACLWTILQAKTCARSGCHSGASPAAGMDLSSAVQVYANWVNVMQTASSTCGLTFRVVPGNPDGSVVIHRLEGTCESQMPIGGPFLTGDELSQFRQWVAAGAIEE